MDSFLDSLSSGDMSSHRGYDPNRVRAKKCETCPFSSGSPVEHLKGYLADFALNTGNRYCHHQQLSGKAPDVICRGARDVQIAVFHRLGVLEAPTDEAWAKALGELS